MTGGATTPPEYSAVVIPCYNEEERLDLAQVEALLSSQQISVILVDDGSTDGTWQMLEAFAARHPHRVIAHASVENHGKGEAVRQGLLVAVQNGAARVGYLDADMATPAAEMCGLVQRLSDHPELRAVLGSRIRLLGHDIRRSGARHYLGRVFATVASLVLKLPVYDTQCGAKVFRVDDNFRAALAEPFSSRWAFDVELLLRITRGPDPVTSEQLLEVPLKEWEDPGGSKLTATAMLRAGLDLLALASRDDA